MYIIVVKNVAAGCDATTRICKGKLAVDRVAASEEPLGVVLHVLTYHVAFLVNKLIVLQRESIVIRISSEGLGNINGIECTIQIIETAIKAIIASSNLDIDVVIPDEYKIAEIIASDNLIGLTLGDINFRDNHKLSLVTIRREFEELENDEMTVKQHLLGVPDNTTKIQKGDVFVLFGKEYDIDNFIKTNL